MSFDSQIQELELTAKEAEEMVSRGEKVRALFDNPIFKEIVVEGYFRDEAARLVHLRTDPNLPEKARVMVENDLNGPPAFNRYLQSVMQMGAHARNAVTEARDMIAEIHAAEVAGEEI